MLLRPKFLLFALLAVTASSCGLKGPLYRPDEPKKETATPAAEPTDTTKKKPGESSSQPPGTPADPDRPAVPPGH